ncbi:tyrosine-type recombinase/integrase [Laspinema sp. D1]|uniref:tyrosine-type recombinase/integrase n=1 Tax=Laspinema palackyanum TaxID=3231601 RepID=UPI00348FB3AB|nr:tyrosine-type recombinase/integrase [Laspinema sp. D2b]
MLFNLAKPSENFITDYSGATSDDHVIQMWIHDKAPSTQKIYLRHVNNFLGFLGKAIANLTVADVYEYANTLSHLKPSTIKSRLYTIKSLLSFANKIGYTQFNIGAVVKPPAVAVGIHQKALKPGQIKALVDSTICDRDNLLIRLGYFSGMRASELSNLTFGNIHDDVITLIGKGSKERHIKLPQDLINELLAQKTPDSTDNSPVFRSRYGGFLRRETISRIVKTAATAAGESGKISAHWLRHSHATNAIEAGEDIKVISNTLGHSSPAFTMQVYVASKPDTSSAMRLSL